MKGRGLFLDRDGVVNLETGYLFRSEHIRFVDGIFSLCRTARRLGYKVVVVTNQAGIAKGYYTDTDFHALMEWMREQFRAEGTALDGVYHSPYHPDGIGEYGREHEDRKPRAGMLRKAARDLELELAESVMVGDRCTDVAAANAGGLRQAFLLLGTEGECECGGVYKTVESLAEVEAWIEARELELV